MKSVLNLKGIAKRMTFVGFFCLVPSAGAQVDCDKQPVGALQRAIDAARPGDTIRVAGTCDENVDISESRNQITIDGRGKASIHGPDQDQDTISVEGRGIVIKGFTITGGLDGIRVQHGGHATIDGNDIERTRQFGIIVTEQGSAIIVNNNIQHIPNIGIVVNGGSFANIGFYTVDAFSEPVLGTNVIRYNDRGMLLERMSSARIVKNDVSFNNNFGFKVDSIAQANIAANTINGNGGHGVLVGRGSGGNLGQPAGDGLFQQPNSTTINNGGFGVFCEKGGYIDGRLGSLNGDRGAQRDETGCINTLLP